MTGLIAALDTPHASVAAAWARALAPDCALLKLGLQYFMSNGPDGVRALRESPVFLDLKLHDIPYQVAGAVHAILPLRPAMLTLHAAGGPAMLEAARRAADAAPPDATSSEPAPLLLAVTVLTSLDETALHATGIDAPPREQVLRLARLALSAGMDGLVCSPHEIAPLRDALGATPILVVPGIRPAGAAIGAQARVVGDDQARVMTPGEAAAAGASYIVVGRPITGSDDPAAAAAAIVAELRA